MQPCKESLFSPVCQTQKGADCHLPHPASTPSLRGRQSEPEILFGAAMMNLVINLLVIGFLIDGESVDACLNQAFVFRFRKGIHFDGNRMKMAFENPDAVPKVGDRTFCSRFT